MPEKMERDGIDCLIDDIALSLEAMVLYLICMYASNH